MYVKALGARVEANCFSVRITIEAWQRLVSLDRLHSGEEGDFQVNRS